MDDNKNGAQAPQDVADAAIELNQAELADDFSGVSPADAAEAFSEPPVFTQKQLLGYDVRVKVKKLDHYAGPVNIEPETPGSSGVDLYAANVEPILLNSMGTVALVPTGLTIELPVGFEAQVRSRSGLAAKNGISVLNSPGTVDSDYRGEIKVILINNSNNRFKIERGMRIAQLVVQRVPSVVYVDVDSLSDTDRGTGGFGSTGV